MVFFKIDCNKFLENFESHDENEEFILLKYMISKLLFLHKQV